MPGTRLFALTACVLPFAGVLAFIPAGPHAVAQPEGSPEIAPAPPARSGGDMAQTLIDALRATEGCLGADAAQFRSGKLAIVAWFENAEAARRWYRSETHARFLAMAGAPPADREPLSHVEDPDAPVMVVAALTFGGRPIRPGGMPMSQISIELYTPLPGGASVNGRLAPDGFDIPHFRRLDAGE